MTYWIDIAAVVFASVTVNHLGLIAAVERVIRHKLPIVNCPKCLSFWSTFAYGVSGDGVAALPSELPRLLAISIFCAYLAIWLELAEGYIDTLYNRLYEQIYPTTDSTDADT
jgi:hypothetical protein